MSPTIRLVLTLHNHQPVGNFDGVFEQAYQESYRPFLDVLDDYPSLPISLHVSGSLMEWLDANHPEYVDRLASLVAAGRIEIVGGAYYEAILPMIPPRDRVGQITRYTQWLQQRLGADVRGMWIPERVWEQGLVSDLAAAGIKYTVLDDFHFRNAGLTPDQLHGYYVTEDNGNIVSVFPGSERLRYLIPFAEPQDTIDYLRSVAQSHPGAVMVFGDDGEKFGTWPDTQKHVYEDGWLRRFFDALLANADWLKTTTLSEAIDHVAPLGKVYLPDCSYREMTEWALPVERLREYERLRHEMEGDDRWPALSQFVQGGFWRNFKVKYPETDEMYSRMLMISNQLHIASQQLGTAAGNEAEQDLTQETRQLLDYARTELYRGQCNCPYWHGAFGGIYLPHLRHAIFNHLIAAENLLHKAQGRTGAFVEAINGDFNSDARPEVLLSNDKLAAFFSPVRGGRMYELDVRTICLNVLSTLARRPEAYHDKVLAGNKAGNDKCASIHDRVVFKQEGLDQRIHYDNQLRKSLVDHFWDNDVSLEALLRNEAMERGDFATGSYEAIVRRSPDRVQIKMTRLGNAWGHPLRITKAVTMEAGSPVLNIVYQLEDLPEMPLHFGVELNFAGLPAGADDRYFRTGGERLGQLGRMLDLEDVQDLGLVDEWLGIDVGLSINRPSHIWTFPIETVSQSEGGFELVHQSVVVQPHWLVEPDAQGKWRVSMQLRLDTSLAESRMGISHHQPEAVAVI